MKFKTSEILQLVREGKNTTKEIIISKLKFKRSEAKTSNPKYARHYSRLMPKLRQMENEGLISKIANASEYEFYLKKK